MVAKLRGLFRISDMLQSIHEVAFVRLLQVKGSRRPHNEEGMIQMEWMYRGKGVYFIRISHTEGMEYLIPLEKGKVWLVNARIDFNTWNKLYK